MTLVLLSLLACSDKHLDSAGGDDSGASWMAPGTIYDLGDHQARVEWIPTEPADPEGVAVRIVWPKAGAARFSDGLPVVVTINGGEKATEIGTPDSEIPTEYPGIVQIRVALPGGGKDPWVSGGEDDRRGAGSAQALGDVLAFALGQGTTVDGWTLDQLLDQRTDPGAVGLFGLSNGGNLALASLVDRSDLESTCWVGTWGTPIDSHYATPIMGDQVNDPDDEVDANGDGVTWNDMVDPDYVPWTCDLERCPGSYRDLRWNGHYLWGDRDGDGILGDGAGLLDLDGNGMRDADEDMDYHWYTAADGRQVYALPTLQAAIDAGILPEPWPGDLLYTMEEAEAFWAQRRGVLFIPRLPEGIRAMITSSSRGHLHAALDQPDQWVTYRLYQQAGHWVRLNADASYLQALRGGGTAPERAANVAIAQTDLPTDMPGTEWESAVIPAGVLEMADRCHLGVWDDDLDGTLAPTAPRD